MATTINPQLTDAKVLPSIPQGEDGTEYRRQHAREIAEALSGLMQDEIAAHGGAEGYLRWVRGLDEQ